MRSLVPEIRWFIDLPFREKSVENQSETALLGVAAQGPAAGKAELSLATTRLSLMLLPGDCFATGIRASRFPEKSDDG